MSDLERLVLEKHQLLRQLQISEALLVTILSDTGPVTLKTSEVERNVGRKVVSEQTKTLIKLSAPEEHDE